MHLTTIDFDIDKASRIAALIFNPKLIVELDLLASSRVDASSALAAAVRMARSSSFSSLSQCSI